MGEELVAAGSASVIDQDIDAEIVDKARRHALYLLCDGDIAGHSDAVSPHRLDLRREPFDVPGGTCGHSYVRAGSGERQGDAAANAFPSSCHHGPLSRER